MRQILNQCVRPNFAITTRLTGETFCIFSLKLKREDVLGAHGWLFVGALCDNTKLLFPVLLLCDEQGNYVDFEEDDLLPTLEQIDDTDIYPYKLSEEDQ